MTLIRKFLHRAHRGHTHRSTAQADEVVDWNQTMFRAGLVAGTSPLVITRVAAIVQAAVFDAVNGIDRRYAPIHVPPAGPAGASRDAAAVQAAYATLVQLYPTQRSLFDARRAVSLAVIATQASSAAVASGVAWGQNRGRRDPGVAEHGRIYAGPTSVPRRRRSWGAGVPRRPRSRQAPDPNSPTMVPWVIGAPSQFRPAGPPPLTSARYAKDFNEVKNIGSVSSIARTPDQTVFSWFWNSATASYLWNTVAASLINRTDDDDRGDSRDEDRDANRDSRPAGTTRRWRMPGSSRS